MRKLVLGAAMLLLAHMGFGQAVNESAIIPVSVTLNAVSRLNIESGGNIKFVFTSIEDYNTGFTGDGNELYKTTVSIASSKKFGVGMYSETANFLPTDDPANATLAISQLEYRLEWTGSAANTPAAADYHATWQQMSNSDATRIINDDAGLAGNGQANRFDIWWRIGTVDNALNTFLDQGDIAPDHYVANIFIELVN